MTPLKKYIWLVDTIMRAGEKGLTLEQIGAKWNADDEMHDDGAFARRSFHRHRNEIEDLFGIRIESYSNGREFRYHIADEGKNDYFQRWLLDSIAVNRIVTDSKEAARYIGTESTDSKALPTLLQALKEQHTVSFIYSPYWSDEPKTYCNFQPHALKMFERRWYLIGRRDANSKHRIFALDRMDNVEEQNDPFRRDPGFNLKKMFENAYGIFVSDSDEPFENVWLKADALQAKYLRSLPLHRLQMEIKTTEEYSIFSIPVRPSYDFIQKLLSLGGSVEVLKPTTLRNEIKAALESMLTKYRDDDE